MFSHEQTLVGTYWLIKIYFAQRHDSGSAYTRDTLSILASYLHESDELVMWGRVRSMSVIALAGFRAVRCFTYNIGKNLLLGGFVKGGELFENGHVQTAYQRALILWITAYSQGIALHRKQAAEVS